jgi:predicted permease
VFDILWRVIVPIFLMMSTGFGVQKTLGLDIRTLTRLNFWIFVPAFLFVKIVESRLPTAALLETALHFALLFVVMFAITWWTAHLLGAGDKLRRAMTACVLFYNSGNYGVPAAQFAFPGSGVAESVQAVVMTLQNFSNFTVGLGLQAGGHGKGRRETLSEIFKLPMIYTFAAACVFRSAHWLPPAPAWQAMHYLSLAMAPVALVTLGAQMATLESYRFRREMALTLFLRLLLAPVVGFALVKAMGLSGVLAQSIVVSTCFPIAINTALLALEFDNEPEYSAAAVFYSTLFSTVTVSLVIYAVRHFM